jgi:hypothetical protein
MRTRTINLLLATGIFTTVAIVARVPRSVEASNDAAHDQRVITRLIGQRQAITIYSTPAGVRYSVDVDGKTIVANATLNELRSKHPASFRHVQSSLADAASLQPWAGIELDDAAH